MLSNREIKWINSLKNKKYRLKERAYLAEGPRLVSELLYNGQTALKIFTTGPDLVASYPADVIVPITPADLKKISMLVQPQGVLAVFQMDPDEDPSLDLHPNGQWAMALDFIQDPGNLGTILRTLSWFGFANLYCSSDSVDLYNPKVVQASMGAIGHPKVHYVDLPEFLSRQTVPVYAAAMEGEPINRMVLEPGILVLGNEGGGLSQAVRQACSRWVSIPKLGRGESLNVAVSAAIMAAWATLH
jgi:TrmH family RNA methyltransferase